MPGQLDPRTLRAIAHPTRNRVLAELSATGPMRAVDLGRELDLPANQVSFHLRQLAKYDLVEEAPELARDRRDRVWRLTDPDGISFRTRDMEAQPGGKAAMAVFRRTAGAWAHHLVDRAYAPLPEGEDPALTISEWSLRLTDPEARELSRELETVVRRWLDQGRGDAPQDGERVTYSLLQLLQPRPDLPADDEAP